MTSKSRTLTIIDAIKDENLLRPFLADRNDSIKTWKNWQVALRCLYGLPINREASKELVKLCTGRDADTMPDDGFSSVLYLTGRRCGKSRVSAVAGAYEAVLAGHEAKLAKGENGLVAICSPTKKQSRIVKNYIRAIFDAPLLQGMIVGESREGFTLSNGVMIELLAGDFRTVRGFTLLAVIVDEAAFFGVDEESKIKSDTELIAALRPALATTGGRLIAITTPYARRGWTFQTYERNFGNPTGKILVWNCASRIMNPTLSQSIIDEGLEEDYAKARAEYFGEFRDDVAAFLSREVIESVVVRNRQELLPRPGTSYSAFVDMSGGRSDDSVLAVAHKGTNRKVVLDKIVRVKPPFNPYDVVRKFAQELRRYGIEKIVGDNYAADFNAGAFREAGIVYKKCDMPASSLYLEFLPRLCSDEVELLDHKVLIDQLANLERRTRVGGKDSVTHPTGGHDDVANAVAGVVVTCFARKLVLGCF